MPPKRNHSYDEAIRGLRYMRGSLYGSFIISASSINERFVISGILGYVKQNFLSVSLLDHTQNMTTFTRLTTSISMNSFRILLGEEGISAQLLSTCS